MEGARVRFLVKYLPGFGNRCYVESSFQHFLFRLSRPFQNGILTMYIVVVLPTLITIRKATRLHIVANFLKLLLLLVNNK